MTAEVRIMKGAACGHEGVYILTWSIDGGVLHLLVEDTCWTTCAHDDAYRYDGEKAFGILVEEVKKLQDELRFLYQKQANPPVRKHWWRRG